MTNSADVVDDDNYARKKDNSYMMSMIMMMINKSHTEKESNLLHTI